MSEKKSILIVGVGSIGERHLRCFASTGRATVSLCEIDDRLRDEVAVRYKVKAAYRLLEDALVARPNGVVICVPAHHHIPLAIAAARAGAHLLIEKPLSTSLDGIEELRRSCVTQHLTVAVAYVYRAHPALSAMRAAITSGRFGAPVQIVTASGQCFPFYRPAYRESYYRDRARGGGAVQDALTHLVNAAEWLVGPVDRLVADWDHLALAGVDVEDTVHVITRHANVMGSISLNQHQPNNETSISVICQRGTARFEYHASRWRWITEPDGPWHDEPAGPLERDTLFIRQAQAFLDAMDNRQSPLCSLDEAEQTLRVNLAILASKNAQRWETISRPKGVA